MIQLVPPLLSDKAEKQLATYQALVLNAGDYTAQVATAKRRFESYNTLTNSTFQEVRARLADMCVGARRCNYCEDSVANEVEHIAPKSLYPERAFQWSNYCYACTTCNSPKSNQYAIFRDDLDGEYYEIPPHPYDKPKPGLSTPPHQLVKPPAGKDVLINPRHENPLDFLLLDITDSFRFVPFDDDPQSISYQRAVYTIRILSLNSRGDLVKARRTTYTNFRARIREYIHNRDVGFPADYLNRLRYNLRDENHQTVWQEMIRQHENIPELRRLFEEARETLNW